MASKKIELKHGKAESTLVIMPFGATIVSWIVDGQERIFVSKKAIYDGTKAIRGGVPVCFPNFGPWPLGPQHGFARTSKDWQVLSEPKVDVNSGDVELVLQLKDTDETRKVWDKKFTFLYTVTLKSKAVELKVNVKNEGQDGDLDLTFCFHTYFTTQDLASVEVTNLKGLTYTDKTVGGWPKVTEENDILKIQGFTDRVYANAPDEVTLTTDAKSGSKLKLTKKGMADWVVWNPFETAAKMADMHENGYLEFVCVEATQTTDRIVLGPGQTWDASHTMEVV